MSNNAMSSETDLDWLARNVHVWPEGKREALVCWPRNVDTIIWSAVLSDAGWITKDQWLARRAELQNKPSWDDAPEWATHLAQNGRGQWWFMRDGEVRDDVRFYFSSSRGTPEITKGEVLGDWRDTLEKRPEEFKQFTSIEDNQGQDMTQQHDMKQDNGWLERGELPPVGSNVTIVEIDGLGISDLGREFIGDECKVMATFVRPAVFHDDEAKIVAVMEPAGGCCCFRLEMVKPIRTEREMAIDEVCNVAGLDGLVFGLVAGKLYDAGYRKEAK
ncbi:hypothetical protein KE336_gp06 [Aeromonas phage 4_D05]|uniref:Uncharacterized protein n=1 Tax=Aeromonas phage 4_D05 TaxID=2588099 RepID=A0A514TU86_9CAUD|nr:hypothetical protein KE336_gp06 [Aeromonas phage 4_D05]QDJ96119.1 hypothetical protein 4D05_006 [Aeromonas phage 4_D05]